MAELVQTTLQITAIVCLISASVFVLAMTFTMLYIAYDVTLGARKK